jgi:hypothetical protein
VSSDIVESWVSKREDWPVAEVDRDDDTIWRWMIHHYQFDPARRERRNVAVAAYDNEREFQTEFERCAQMIRNEIAAGTRSSRENLNGVVLEPGHLAASALGHNVRRAIEHGVNPARLLATGPLPQNMAVLTFATSETAPLIEDDGQHARERKRVSCERLLHAWTDLLARDFPTAGFEVGL